METDLSNLSSEWDSYGNGSMVQCISWFCLKS